MSKTLRRILGSDTVVPLGIVAAVVIPILSVLSVGGWQARSIVYEFLAKIDNVQTALTAQVAEVDKKVEKVNGKVDKLDGNLKEFRLSMSGDRWTYGMMQLAFLDMAQKNIKLKLPDYQKIHDNNPPPFLLEE